MPSSMRSALKGVYLLAQADELLRVVDDDFFDVADIDADGAQVFEGEIVSRIGHGEQF